MREFSYDSDLIGGSLLVREARIIADLLFSKADDSCLLYTSDAADE